ncbi:MAG: DUF4292 domain-containing protein [Balneolaceae bacterium]|nr:DUF4292 domain-containing protein [Balneolaceae bacterium]
MNYPVKLLIPVLLVVAACSTPRVVEQENLSEADISSSELVGQLPDYGSRLDAIRGKGKALVSEPGNTERVTVLFTSDRDRSLVTVKSGIGIEGGKLLASGDSLLIYNRVDKYARKISAYSDRLSSIDHLATINILNILNYVPVPQQADRILESEESYWLIQENGLRIQIDRKDKVVLKVVQPEPSRAPYSRIVYEAYGEEKGFRLPRRITIYSADRRSKVALLIQSLEINPENVDLNIDIPENIPIVRL